MVDVTRQCKTASFSGVHTATLKCVRIKPQDPSVICSAGRDNLIVCWDTRIPALGPSAAIRTFHKPTSNKRTIKSIQKQVSESVTGLCFLQHSPHLFVACFAPSGELHLFDIRKETASLDAFIPDSGANISFTSLAVNPYGSRLYALCTDNQYANIEILYLTMHLDAIFFLILYY
jgi:WD40 repeat protein